MSLTSKRNAKHPFAVQNTQQMFVLEWRFCKIFINFVIGTNSQNYCVAVLTFVYQKTDEIPVQAAVEEDPSILIEKEKIAAMEREAFDLVEKRLARQEKEIVEMNEKFEQQSKAIEDILVRTFDFYD